MRFLRVTHSIPDGMAVAVDTPLRHGPAHRRLQDSTRRRSTGAPTDLHGFAEEASGRGVHLLLSDSTNAEEAGYTTSETERRPGAARHRARTPPGIVVAACFSSHIHRIQQIVDAAVADERVVAFLGRSMHNSVARPGELGSCTCDDRDVGRHRGGRAPRPRPRRGDLHGIAGRAVSARSR